MSVLIRPALVTRLLAACILLAGCGGGGDDPGPRPAGPDPFADYRVDPDLYELAPDPARLLSVPASLPGAPAMQFPADQLLLVMEPGAPRSEAERVAEALGGAIVGQVPRRGLYQIRVPATTRGELDAARALAEADAAVRGAAYNLLGHPMQCPAPSDIGRLILLEDRCPFDDIGYYDALTIFDHIRSRFSLSTVRVAVVDTGIQANNREFDGVRILNLADPGAPNRDLEEHGTYVASLIAADDDGAGINGIASRFLGPRLLLLNGTVLSRAVLSHLVAVERALDARADVLNLSFGWAWYGRGLDVGVIREAWERVMRANPAALFVCAADNLPYDLTADNYAPGGIALDNVITVGGTRMCAPAEAWSLSATGPRITIAAPSENVPVATKVNGHVLLNHVGNSLSTPMVSAVAAVLKSMDPTLTPRQIRDNYLVRYAFPTAARVSGARLYMPLAIEQLLIDLGPGVPASVRDLVDGDGNLRYDDPWQVINRICGGVQYRVDGFGSWQYAESDLGRPGISVSGRFGADSVDFSVMVPFEANLIIGGHGGCAFELDRAYPIHRDPDRHPGTMGLAWSQEPTLSPPSAIGVGVAGAVVFDSCRIAGRYMGRGEPLTVSIAGSFDAGMEVVDAGGGLRFTDAAWFFNILFLNRAPGTGTLDPVIRYMEEHCEGGRPTR